MDYTSANANARQLPSGPVTPAVRDPDEINLLEYIYALVKHKKLIAGLTLLGLVLGFIAALIKGPTWTAEALIAPKETESQKTQSLSGLGALGGLVASQLNLSGNASLDKMDMTLDSRDFGAKLIKKYSLLPAIYRYKWPKQYRKYWDPAANNWKPAFKKPRLLAMGGFLKVKFLKKTMDAKSNTILMKIRSKDSAFTFNLATNYVEYLNEYIKARIKNEARGNVAYLDSQLVAVIDPLLQEKIQELIAHEIEKEMVVSNEAFRVVDPVYVSKTFKEKKLFPLVFGFGLFFMGCMAVVFLHAFSSAGRTEEDRQLIEKIKREMAIGRKRPH
jgi:hypothetical protein